MIEGFLRGSARLPAGLSELAPTSPTARLAMANTYLDAGLSEDAERLHNLSQPVVVIAGRVLDPEANFFSPARAREERYQAMRARRKSKVQPSQENRRKPVHELARVAGDVFTDHGYAAAVRSACERAGVKPWHPNQLRHLFATEVRARYGLEAAQVVLGHAKADVTQMYAERNLALADKVAAEMG